jgi:hypothetical protein
VRFGSGCQDIVAFGGQALEYLDYVIGGLSRAEYDLGKTSPDLTMVIYAGKAEILERQVAQLLHGFVDFDLTGLYLFKKFFNLFRLNKTPTFLDSTASQSTLGWLIGPANLWLLPRASDRRIARPRTYDTPERLP